MRFVKAQGLGNDFVMLINPKFEFENDSELNSLCKTLANRRYGIGCDQIIIAQDIPNNNDMVNIRFFNADGSEAESCGNGSRCIAKYLMIEIFKTHSIQLKTISGILNCKLCDDNMVEIEMPLPIVKVLTDLEQLEGFTSNPTMTSVQVGNPHLICFINDDDDDSIDDIDLINKYGSLYENHIYFQPERTNVEFVKIISRTHIKLVVFERGCGITPACGSGACGSMVAAMHHGLVESDDILVSQPGGNLVISYKNNTLTMKGPGEVVFTGEYLF